MGYPLEKSNIGLRQCRNNNKVYIYIKKLTLKMGLSHFMFYYTHIIQFGECMIFDRLHAQHNRLPLFCLFPFRTLHISSANNFQTLVEMHVINIRPEVGRRGKSTQNLLSARESPFFTYERPPAIFILIIAPNTVRWVAGIAALWQRQQSTLPFDLRFFGGTA